MSNNHEIKDQNLHLTTSNQMFELDDNELDNIAGGGGRHRKPDSPKVAMAKKIARKAGPIGNAAVLAYEVYQYRNEE